MTYPQTLHYLLQQLPMFQRVGVAAYRSNLTNIIKLCDILGNPQQHLKCIHIAGTNGKGSVTHILASILQEQGFKVGVYVSPHYKDYRERIKINGKYISKKFVTEFVTENEPKFKAIDASFFEITTAMAFAYFKKEKVDFAVIETGMGGRLDSTNIIKPLVSVITNISLDHQQFLGDTLPLIAAEKAGIIKPDIPIVIGETHRQSKAVFIAKAKQTSSSILFADTQTANQNYKTDLIGLYQSKNITTALAAIKVLRQNEIPISEKSVRKGLKNVGKNTSFIGRWMVVSKRPFTILDSAHNQAGLAELSLGIAELVKEKNLSQVHFVYGTVGDKDISKILLQLPKNATYYFCHANIPRALNSDELKVKAELCKLYGDSFSSVKKAFKAAESAASKNDLIVVAGSVFVVAEVI